MSELAKTATGIAGLDEITGGGLPQGRPTLVSGTAGCGKTLMGVEFLVRGATQYGEPGVFVAFEEHAHELAENVRSLGYDLPTLEADGKVIVDHIHLDRHQIDETGEYDLEGLFVRLNHAIDSIRAKRVVIDTIETLFSALTNHAVLRAELRRLFQFLKKKGVTAIITCERGDGALTRHGIEEYVSDCVILLDHRVENQLSTRRMRVVKYRGSAHGSDEYPFLIDRDGFSVLPITSIGLTHQATSERISSGLPALDGMLGGKGFYRGSTVLVSGTAGTGKSSLAATFVNAACANGERCLYLAFEESPSQIVRNMRSVGLDLQPWVDQHLLRFHAARPTQHGLEMHLAVLHKFVNEFKPAVVILDPISNLANAGANLSSANAMLVRTIDFLKMQGVTAMFTHLTTMTSAHTLEQTDIGVSSLVDTWILVRDMEWGGRRTRALFVLKSRGMAHSHEVREFLLSDQGIELRQAMVGTEGVIQDGTAPVRGRRRGGRTAAGAGGTDANGAHL